MVSVTENELEKPRWWAQAILIGAVIGAVLLLMGGFGTRLGMWSYNGGFTVASGGILLASAGFFLGVIGYVVALRKGLNTERSSILIALLICIILLVQVGMQVNALASVPAIHNISTDTQDPPAFDALVAVRAAEGANPLVYDANVLAEPQREAYPWVQTLQLPTNPGVLLNEAVSVLEDMGLAVVNVSAEQGIIEATATTFWFGFKDDVVIRVRESAVGGSVIDVRSVSRSGQSDLGVNAKRIGTILQGLRG
jgi:uncharacterized protein (DUF1499 family)